jgi:hypothetical protein
VGPGSVALVAVRAADLGNAVAGETPGRIVLRDGRIVARTRTAAELALPELRAAKSAWNLPGAYCAGKTYRERIVPLTGAARRRHRGGIGSGRTPGAGNIY